MSKRGSKAGRSSPGYDMFGAQPRRRVTDSQEVVGNGYVEDYDDALERGEYEDPHPHVHSRTVNSYGYTSHGWTCNWQWNAIFTAINFIAVVVLGIFFIIHATSNHQFRTGTLGNVSPGQTLNVVSSSVKLPPTLNQVHTRSYKFQLNSIYARYPADGGTIPELQDHDHKTAKFCCDKKIASTLRTTTNRVCASTGKVLEYTVETPEAGSDGYVLVTANKDLIGAQCTLTWTTNKQPST